ncbi:VIT domain-containing protein [Tenacibaculum xiamenense]|uniref:VIT domain-containing protein n=1 Tax=Tenacibaculum xiamenense TaxID=1261553 RepID=UPI003895F515
MKNLIFIYLFLVTPITFSQRTPKLITGKSNELRLSSLKVEVNVIGNYATTTYDMQFYNELDRTLEGELVFPLGEGQTVFKFAMEINGKLRESVIVEKELARTAFESTIRQRIDPALLEKTSGNNYKARVYPILPNSYKRIVLTYEEKLTTKNKRMVYQLPLGIDKEIENFSVDIFAIGKFTNTLVKSKQFGTTDFIRKGNLYSAYVYKKNVAPNKAIDVILEKNVERNEVLFDRDYFYASVPIQLETNEKIRPDKITILWDISSSMRNRDLKREYSLLDKYFRYLNNVKVELITFSNTINSEFNYKIRNGNWSKLKSRLGKQRYDGGTNFDVLKQIKLTSNEVLLFSDGLSNLGSIEELDNTFVYTINSLTSADHFNLNRIAEERGGVYLNLGKIDVNSAQYLLTNQKLQFLGVENGPRDLEVYPKNKKYITGDFVITGKLSKKESLQLKFGYQNKVTKRITVDLKKGVKSKKVKRLWAKERLKHLMRDKGNNQNEIISLAKEHHLITDYTSMLILDRIEDYVRYKIEPPVELKREYKRRLKETQKEDESLKKWVNEEKETLIEGYGNLKDWYATKFPKKREKSKDSKLNQTNTIPRNVSQNENLNSNNQNLTENTNPDNVTVNTVSNDNTNNELVNRQYPVDYSKRVVSGMVKDESGPLPGATVLIKGTTHGTETDFDGNFSINANEDDTLVFSFVGMKSIERKAGASLENVVVLENDNLLEEVVVVAYGTTRKTYSTSSAVSSITSDTLEGKVSGVMTANVANENNSVVIRGTSSIALSSNNPLYIIDGIVATENGIKKLNKESIYSIEVLKPIDAVKLYGERGKFGVIIITTKEGIEENKKEIEELNLKIEEELELKGWNPKMEYLDVLSEEKSIKRAYEKYLKIRDYYSNSPTFYLDVADFFKDRKEKDLAIRILTNLAEIELDDYELLKALAYKLEYFEEYDMARVIYEKILDLRPEEPQSYRDLALVYELSGEYQKSFELLYKIYNGELLVKDKERRFEGIESITFVELCKLVNTHGNHIKLTKEQKELFINIPVDIRIVVDWNHNDTDLDLWVVDPAGEKASYKNIETNIGGRMSFDMTEGYGPEEFMLRAAKKGTYKIEVNYYSDAVQKISGPTILKVTVYKNYARKNESKKTVVMKLDKKEGSLEVDKVVWR